MKNIVLLHGALGTKTDLEPLQLKLQNEFKVHLFEFSGHGSAGFQSTFGIRRFSAELEKFIVDNDLGPCAVFGYSMGGYVALYLASQQPGMISNIITYATKFVWTKDVIDKEIKMCQPEIILEKAPGFAQALQKKHDDWRTLLEKVKGMISDFETEDLLPPDDLLKIDASVLIGVGDKDKMVTIGESQSVFRTIKNASMFVLPDSKHPLDSADPEFLAMLIRDHLKKKF